MAAWKRSWLESLWSFFLLCLPCGRAVKVVLIGGAATGADRYIMMVCRHGCDDVSDGVSTDEWAPGIVRVSQGDGVSWKAVFVCACCGLVVLVLVG